MPAAYLCGHHHPKRLLDLISYMILYANGNRTKVTKEFLRTPVQVSATYQLGK